MDREIQFKYAKEQRAEEKEKRIINDRFRKKRVKQQREKKKRWD